VSASWQKTYVKPHIFDQLLAAWQIDNVKNFPEILIHNQVSWHAFFIFCVMRMREILRNNSLVASWSKFRPDNSIIWGKLNNIIFFLGSQRYRSTWKLKMTNRKCKIIQTLRNNVRTINTLFIYEAGRQQIDSFLSICRGSFKKHRIFFWYFIRIFYSN